MKIKFLPLLFLGLLLVNCDNESTDDMPENPEPTQDGVLIKRIDETYGVGLTYSIEFNYNENQLIAISDNDGYNSTLEYTDGLLTRLESYDDGDLQEYITYSYNSNNVLESFSVFFELDGLEGLAYRHELSYNSDGTITQEIYRGDHESQTEIHRTIEMDVTNGNINRWNYDSNNGFIEYEFDDQNGMFKNIYAIQVLELSTYSTESTFAFHGSNNNVTKIVDEDSFSKDEDVFNYSYNEDGYPVSAIYEYYSDGEFLDDATLTFTYE